MQNVGLKRKKKKGGGGEGEGKISNKYKPNKLFCVQKLLQWKRKLLWNDN